MQIPIRLIRPFSVVALFYSVIFLCVISPAWSASGVQDVSWLPEKPETTAAWDPIDTLYLDEILIQSTRIREPLHYQPVEVQHVDSMRLAHHHSRSVSEVLSRYSGLFIRDNGPGGLATLSQRGLTPSQSQILWEGFPINSLSLGMADLSLLPAGLFQSVEVSPGTPSSAFGGTGPGGTVWLSSTGSGRENRIDLVQSAGAFDTRNSRLHGVYDSGPWTASIQGIYHTAQNDFRYFNRATGRYESRNHNVGKAGHVKGTVGYRFTGGRFYSSFWYLDSKEEIPGSVLMSNTRATQSNRTFRWLAGGEARAGSWRMDIRAFLERDHYHYKDLPLNIDSRFHQGRRLLEMDFRRPSTGTVVWQGGISGGQEEVKTSNYADDRQRLLLGLRLNPEVRYPSWRLRFTPALRVDSWTGFGYVLSPSLGGNWEVSEKRFLLRAMISHDFNPPSFNDLYWAPGGNPDLKPERSFRTEGGFVFLPEFPLIEEIRWTGYRIRLNQGIYWFPGQQGIWSPSNVEEVNACGMEAGLDLRLKIQRVKLFWDTGLNWRRSEIARERFAGDAAVGKQMRYVPEWTLRSNLDLRISPFMIHASYRWTGQRFVTEDHTTALEPYRILDLSASMQRSYRGLDGYMRLTVNNLLNESYEVIQWYPMPGRHVEFTLGTGIPIPR